MKKISVSVLLAFLLIGLIACSNNDENNSNQNNDNQAEESTNQEASDKEKIDFDIKNETDESENENLKKETENIVTALATGKVEGAFYDQFSDDMVKTIKDAVQDGSEEGLSDEELTNKFLNNYVQLSDKVKGFTDENGEIEEVVINHASEDELELEEGTQTTMDVDATIVAENEEEFPLEMLFDITSGDYEYINISSPRT